MKRISVTLCASLVLALVAVGTARAEEIDAQGHGDYDNCPAKSWWACDDAGGKFHKHAGKKFCFIEGETQFLKCVYGYKAVGQKTTTYIYSKWIHDKKDGYDNCAPHYGIDIVKCWKKDDYYGSKKDGYHGWTRVDDDDCKYKCRLPW